MRHLKELTFNERGVSVNVRAVSFGSLNLKTIEKIFFCLVSKFIILICSSGNDSHLLGKLKSGKGSSLAKFGYKF